ncbi:alpha/beta fold hydrolase [Actinomyces glycerinitolerans]|uniref:Alpha/beta hydrolase fold-1 n=1 Tax=Actinomyces glycerinitolerans TaxID=1892869 RepID=A0A1M4RWJ9_9ACTO|nr:alpha/beta fold hydrolase [Actinomyces glycerinitolerans]SHE24338.1 alpha/beta hydrolase fold-1 [Actinomyces glycerinitolerans]
MNTSHAFDLDAPPLGAHALPSETDQAFQALRWAELIGPHAIDEISALSPLPRTNAGWVGAYLHLARGARTAGRDFDAVVYERAAQFFMSGGDPRRFPIRERFVDFMRQRFSLDPVDIPCDGAVLPAYDLPALRLGPSEEPRSTWVVCGGFDSYIEEWFPLLDAVARRGHRVIAFDGPGQGGVLEEQGVPLVAGWERPVSAVLDHFGLNNVTLVGLSLGGELVIRAAAFETRVKRVVAWDVMDDFLDVLMRQVAPVPPHMGRAFSRLPSVLVDRLLALASRRSVIQWGLEQGMRVTGTRSPAQFLRFAGRLHTREASPGVRADVLLLAGAEDHYVPLSQLTRQADSLTGARSVTTRVFTEAEGCASHCQVGNLGLAVRTILAWEEPLLHRD